MSPPYLPNTTYTIRRFKTTFSCAGYCVTPRRRSLEITLFKLPSIHVKVSSAVSINCRPCLCLRRAYAKFVSISNTFFTVIRTRGFYRTESIGLTLAPWGRRLFPTSTSQNVVVYSLAHLLKWERRLESPELGHFTCVPVITPSIATGGDTGDPSVSLAGMFNSPCSPCAPEVIAPLPAEVSVPDSDWTSGLVQSHSIMPDVEWPWALYKSLSKPYARKGRSVVSFFLPTRKNVKGSRACLQRNC